MTAGAINDPQRNAVSFQFDVPLAQLKPGTYICQVNVIDDAGGSFTFPRMALRITAPATPPSAPAAAVVPGGLSQGQRPGHITAQAEGLGARL